MLTHMIYNQIYQAINQYETENFTTTKNIAILNMYSLLFFSFS